jgi:hypothetical protein
MSGLFSMNSTITALIGILVPVIGSIIIEIIRKPPTPPGPPPFHIRSNKITTWGVTAIVAIICGIGGYLIGMYLFPPPNTTIVQDSVRYVDFEKSEDLNGWTASDLSIVNLTGDKAFKDDHSLAVKTKGTNGKTSVLVLWDHPMKADLVIGRVFWPIQKDVQVIWAQACVIWVGECYAFPVTSGQWNAFALDLYGRGKDDKIGGLYVQGGINTVDSTQTYTFYLDDIETYTSLDQ